MKGLVSYSSRTGNTKKLAATIAEVLSRDHEMNLMPIHEVKDLSTYDFILHGFWVRMMEFDPQTKEFLKKIPHGKKVGLFGTSAGEHTSTYAKPLVEEMERYLSDYDSLGMRFANGSLDRNIVNTVDGIMGTLLPQKLKDYVDNLAKNSREATREEREDIGEFFRSRLML